MTLKSRVGPNGNGRCLLAAPTSLSNNLARSAVTIGSIGMTIAPAATTFPRSASFTSVPERPIRSSVPAGGSGHGMLKTAYRRCDASHGSPRHAANRFTEAEAMLLIPTPNPSTTRRMTAMPTRSPKVKCAARPLWPFKGGRTARQWRYVSMETPTASRTCAWVNLIADCIPDFPS